MRHSSDPANTMVNVTALPRRAERKGEDFFVAGGPVAPERPCYIVRGTDEQLYQRLLAGDYCHIIAPRLSGKSSLVVRTAARLRAQGRLVAIIDLSQLGSRDGSTEVGRWYYGLAYRVLRDLRLKLDLQSWWQERMPLPPAQRLGEFFGEVVVGAARAPVTIFFDEIDSLEQLDYATELFSVVRACHDARAGEPNYQRLTFALLGTALPAGSAATAGRAAIEISTRLDLPDFSFEEARPLAQGLGLAEGDAERALYRVMYWSGGHPYLTQKLSQAVARNAARITSDDAVDRLVAARFLARNVVTTESSMSRVLDALERAGKLARPALRLYRRIQRGRKPRYEPDNPQHELLRVCGLVTVTAEGALVVRNRIYAQVFTHRWSREALPPDWGKISRTAAALALVAGAVWTYLEVLPRPYEETLRVASVEIHEAVEAWSGLRRIPGFGARADRLLARVLIRASRLAPSWPEAEKIDAHLRALNGYQARADALMVEYWERRAAAAEAAEHRDEALLYRLRANVAGPTADSGLAAALAGGDYRRLQAVIRTAGLVDALAPSPDGRGVVTVSAGNVVERWDAATGFAEAGQRSVLLVEEFVPVRRRLSLDTAGRTSALRVELALEHPRPADLRISLSAPSGRRVELSMEQARLEEGMLVFDEAGAPPLRGLRGEQVLGTWQLEIEDRETGAAGFFNGWILRASPLAAHRAEDRPENSLLLPTPSSSSAVRVALSPRGSAVAALPRNQEARGRLRAWQVAGARLLVSMQVGAGERWIGFADETTLLLVEGRADGQRLSVVDLDTGGQRFEVPVKGLFTAGPAVSPDGLHVAMAEAGRKVAWIRELASGRETFRLPSAGEVTAVAVAPGGLMLAVVDPGDVVRLWHASDGALLAELRHDGRVVALRFDRSGKWLATVDDGRQVRVWDVTAPTAPPILSRPGGDPRHFGFDDSGRRFATLNHNRGYEVWELPGATPYGPILRHGGISALPPSPVESLGGGSPMFADQGRLIGGRGTRSVTVWQVEPEGAPIELPRIAPVVALARSGLRMAAGLGDGRVVLRMHDPESLRMRQSQVTTGEVRHGGAVTALAFTPDGSGLVSLGADGSVLLWNAFTGSPIGARFQHGGGRVEAIDFGPDGRLLVTAGELGARTWDAEAGAPGPALGPGRPVTAVALDAAGRRAFTGTPDGDVESWDAATGERLWVDNVAAPVTQIASSADGERLAVAGPTGLVRAWGMALGDRALGTVLAAPVVGLQFSPDGMSVLAQTPAWLHRLGVADGRLQVLASRMLPAAVPPGAWRSASPDGLRVALIGGLHSEAMTVLDFGRAPLPPDDWAPDLGGWQQRLKLQFSADGELIPAPASPGL
jgi:WD40 repeat protein